MLSKIGNIAIASIELASSTAFSGYFTTIATLPAEFRPASSGRIAWLVGDNGDTHTGSIETDGSIKLNGSISADYVIATNFAYVVA